MKLTDEVKIPRWIKVPVRFFAYAMVLYILYNICAAIVFFRLDSNIKACHRSMTAVKKGDALGNAKRIAECLDQQNGVLENLMMRPIHQAINALPNNPSQFVGVWNSSQPRCNYKITLKADGEFLGEPVSCTISSDRFNGTWGVFENQMIWLYERGADWPPDINAMDVVDKDFFLLVEKDGSRTKFTRTGNLPTQVQDVQPTGSPVAMAPRPVESNDFKSRPLEEPDGLEQWSDGQVKDSQALLDSEKFSEIKLEKNTDWSKHIPPDQLADFLKLLADSGCTKGDSSVFTKQGKTANVIVTSDCRASEGAATSTFAQYPQVIVVGQHGVKAIDLSQHGFMYESGKIDAFTDINNNGLIEIWLSGSICECDGEAKPGADKDCDCHGIVVVEDT